MRIRARLIAAAVLFLVGVELPLRAAHASDADIIRSGKRATALVEIGDAGTGTAFCIDPKGLFVINHHVVAALPPGQRLRIVINPADDGQRIFETDIVAVSESADLALIWARDATNLTALSLGDDKDLIETQPITAFGYPFGKMLAVDSKHYPSISINTGKVTSLRRDEGKLSHIQVDATINPGNSGGPVLDASGKVVGVISSGVQTFFGPAGINFAVPVSRLRELVNVPHLLLATPAVSYADRFQPVNFTCRVIDLGAEHAGLKLTLTLNSPGMAPRTIDLARNPDGTFSSKAAPATKSAGASRMLAASVLGEKGLVTGWVQDHPIQVGASTVELSKVKTFDRYPNPHVKTSDGRAIQGEVSGLGQIQFASSDGGKIDLASSFRVQVNSASQGEGGVSYRVLARQAEKIIAELGGVISFKDAPENAQGEIETEQPVPAYGGSTEEPLQTIRLPSGIDSAKLGGSGQLLAVHIKPARVFAIIDLHAAKVIRYIPVDADIVVAAAGANDLVIYVHGLHELRRYDLRSGRLLLSSRLEIDRHLDRLEMGASSTGPVLARTGNNLKRFYDVPTLRHMTMQWRQTISNFEQYRASADGATFSGWFGGGAYRLHTWANKVTGRFVGIDYGDLYPNFDGSGLYTLNAVLGPDFSQIVQKTDEHRFLPTWSPGLYVQLGFGGLTSQVQAELHNALDQKAICALPPMPELTVAPKSKPADLWIDRRMMFFPADNLIVSIPFTDDRVVIRHFDFDRAIAKASGGAAMYVKSAPPMRFVDGRPYSYAVQVGGGKQPYKYHLDAGPAGMNLSGAGRLTWSPTADIASDEIPVVVTISDAGGGRVVHRFALQPERNPPDRCPRLRVDGTAIADAVRSEYDRLFAVLGRNTTDAATCAKFAELCLEELDAPELAQQFRTRLTPDLAHIVELASRQPGELVDKEATDLAQWYFDRGSRLKGEAKTICLRNASLYWSQWTLGHPEMDGARTDVERNFGGSSEAFKIDLLSLLKNDLYVLGGSWKLTNNGLEAAGGDAGDQHPRVQFPCRPEGSYRLHVEFTAQAGPEADVIFPVGASNATLVLGGWNGHAAIMEILGQRPNHSEFGPFVMQPNHRYSVDILVALRDDEASVFVTLDGVALTSWKGKQTNVQANAAWSPANKESIGVGCAKMAATFHVATLFPINRDRFTRPVVTLGPTRNLATATYLSDLNLNAKHDASHALEMTSGATISVPLGKRYSSFEGSVHGVSESMTFRIKCDGREVWTGTARKGGADQSFAVDVQNAEVMEVSCTGPAGARGLWVAPRMLGIDETPAISKDAPLWKLASESAGNDHVAQASNLVGGRGGQKFDDFPPGGGVLVGLRVTMDLDQRDWHIASVQGVYLTADGKRVAGERHGQYGKTAAAFDAPPGYAISALRIAGENMVDGFDIACMPLNEKGLGPQDVDPKLIWLGRSKPRGPKREIGGSGKPIVGLSGRAGEKLEALGVYFAP